MNFSLFLFCGGASIDSSGKPKPLMKIRENRSLLVHFLYYLLHFRTELPAKITLLCDDGQEIFLRTEIEHLSYPIAIDVMPCGMNATTFDKFRVALERMDESLDIVQFGYPDIFFLDQYEAPKKQDFLSAVSTHISAVALTSRFPRLIIDIYKNEIRGISNYSSNVPANPLYIFGGDLWGRKEQLRLLICEFRAQEKPLDISFEYDFFFWLINHKKMRCVMLHGEQLRVDSPRDIFKLLSKTGNLW